VPPLGLGRAPPTVPNWPPAMLGAIGWGWPAETTPAEESSRQAPIVTDDMRYLISGLLLSKL
jgi:hypothetical protein